MAIQTTTVDEERVRFLYQILSDLRNSGTREYHRLSSAYLAGNSILVTALSILFGSIDATVWVLILIISGMGLFLCVQMWLAQCRFRAINTSYAERLRVLEAENDWLPPIFTDSYHIEDNKPLSSTLERPYYHTRGIRWGKCILGGRMKLLPYIFSILFIVFFLFSLWKTFCT